MVLAALTLSLAPSLTFQRASISLVPDEPLPLGGYTERQSAPFEPGGDDLQARVILIRQGKVGLALVSAEMLTAPESLVREVQKQIPPPYRLFLAASHTHCAPDSQMLNDRMTFALPGIATYRRRQLEWTANRIGEAIRQAATSKPQPQTELSIQVRLLDLNRPRRVGANPDRRASLVKDTDGMPFFLQYAAHPTLYGPEERRLRGDWIGAWMVDHEAPALLGPIGDVSPASLASSPAEATSQFVREISKVFGPYPGDLIDTQKFSWTEVQIPLDSSQPHPTFAQKYGLPQPLADNLVQRFAPPEAKITAFRIGKLAVVGVPGEPTSALGREIEQAGRREGFRWTLVCSHVNGWIGYILEPEDYDRGGYEAQLSFHGRKTAQRVASAAAEALRSLARGK